MIAVIPIIALGKHLVRGISVLVSRIYLGGLVFFKATSTCFLLVRASYQVIVTLLADCTIKGTMLVVSDLLIVIF